MAAQDAQAVDSQGELGATLVTFFEGRCRATEVLAVVETPGADEGDVPSKGDQPMCAARL